MVDFSKLVRESWVARGWRGLPILRRKYYRSGVVSAVFTDLSTNRQWTKDIKWNVGLWTSKAAKPNEYVLYLNGASTGYESILFTPNDDKLAWMSENGWFACAGTAGGWNQCFIPAAEMKKVYEEIVQ